MLYVLFRLLCNNLSLEQQSCCAAIGEVFPSKRHEGHQSEAQPLHCKATSELAHCVICGVASSSHTLQLLQPDVVTVMQHDLTQKFTTISAIASVAGSALGSVGRSLNI